MTSWTRSTLGRTGREVCRLGISAAYGVPAAGVERAFEQGVNYFYWGSARRGGFGRALRNLAPQRGRFLLAVQSYSRIASLIPLSLERALRKLHMDYTDVLLLGMWNHRPPERILDACRKARERGLARYIAVSSHNRPFIPALAQDPGVDIVHVRYNAVHTGAEREVFPVLPADPARPGVVSFTATCWRQLLNSKKTPPGEKTPTALDCYRFVLSNPAVDICLTGPSNATHVDESLRALELGPMTPDELAWMRRVGDAIHKK